MRRLAALLLAVTAAACGAEQVVLPRLPPPARVTLMKVLPAVALPGTTLSLQGAGYSSGAGHKLQLKGRMGNGTVVDLQLPVTVVSQELGTAEFNQAPFDTLGEGTFSGTAAVISSSSGGMVTGAPLSISLELKKELTPVLTAGGSPLVYLNSRVPVVGRDFLLGGQEGTAEVTIQGCFLPDGTSGTCAAAGRKITARLALRPEVPGQRDRAYFEFSPAIVGLKVGLLEGTMLVRNLHAGSRVRTSSSLKITAYLDRSLIRGISPATVSLGQYLDIRGRGFIGGKDASTAVAFKGSYRAGDAKGSSVTAAFDLVTAYQSGNHVRYVLEESMGPGSVVDLRKLAVTGALEGTWSPTIYYKSGSATGVAKEQLTLYLAGVKQVVWVRFTQGWAESLRQFGVAAADQKIRARVLKAMAKQYRGINLEFRESEPTDFKLYAKLDIGGKDPNGLSLMGYDNTPGKDVDNARLYDWVGGVNASTQQDGYPGYGGVFLESLLSFSEHPPKGVLRSPLRSALFDQIYDLFRPDRGGKQLTSDEASGAESVGDKAACPAGEGDGRIRQAACAIAVLGSVVGTTASHELGHSLGLAEPYGSASAYHNPGDKPNRLMDAGAALPFAERAEIQGQGPAVFCAEEFTYLQKILPLDPKPADHLTSRPTCN